jgi:hypothetical protein
MLTISNDRLNAAEREKHETILALDETEQSLRKKRMWASFQIFGLIFAGLAVSVLTYNLATGGPEQFMSVLPRTAGTAAIFLVVLTLLSGRGAKRDFAKLQEFRQEAVRALASDKAETVNLDLDENTFVVRHPQALWLATSQTKGTMVVDLTSDETLGEMFRQPTPPLRHISWLQDPETGAISHAIQRGLPPAELDRIDLPAGVPISELQEAIGVAGKDPLTSLKRSVSELRGTVAALVPQ